MQIVNFHTTFIDVFIISYTHKTCKSFIVTDVRDIVIISNVWNCFVIYTWYTMSVFCFLSFSLYSLHQIQVQDFIGGSLIRHSFIFWSYSLHSFSHTCTGNVSRVKECGFSHKKLITFDVLNYQSLIFEL